MNSVQLFGRLGNDPQQRVFSTGGSIVTFHLATDDFYTDREGQRQRRTQWHRIVAAGPTGEICLRYLKKGRQAAIDGAIHYRHWTDPSSGQEKWSTEIRAYRVDLPDQPRSGEDMAPSQPQDQNYGAPVQQQAERNYAAPVQQGQSCGAPAQQSQSYGAPVQQSQPAQRPAVRPEDNYGIPGDMSDVPF